MNILFQGNLLVLKSHHLLEIICIFIKHSLFMSVEYFSGIFLWNIFAEYFYRIFLFYKLIFRIFLKNISVEYFYRIFLRNI